MNMSVHVYTDMFMRACASVVIFSSILYIIISQDISVRKNVSVLHMTEHVNMSVHVCVSVLMHIHVSTIVYDCAQLHSKMIICVYMSTIVCSCVWSRAPTPCKHGYVCTCECDC